MRCRVTVVGYVCVSGSIFSCSNELAKKTYRSPQRCTTCFSVKRLLHKATEFVSKLGAKLSALLFTFVVHHITAQECFLITGC